MTSPPNHANIYYRLISVGVLLLIFHAISIAQEIYPSVSNTDGFYKKTDNGSIAISIGELAVSTINGSAGIITQGFLQPEIQPPCSDFDLDYFPNPVTDFITIRDTACGKIIHRIEVFNMVGNYVMGVRLVNREADLSNLRVGLYIIRGYDATDKVLGTFKIVKIKD